MTLNDDGDGGNPARVRFSIPLTTMAPDRGHDGSHAFSSGTSLAAQGSSEEQDEYTNFPHHSEDEGAKRDSEDGQTSRQDAEAFLSERAKETQNFTVRGVVVGLAIGLVICFSNMYFGLQTGWVSGMNMPSALIGFAFFKSVSRLIALPFTPVENVLVQSVAGSVGTMPLGCGFVGVVPALNFLLKPEENGPLRIDLWKLIVWAVGICFFGVAFAVPLRREVIIREKLKFPSGTATALMIGVLHGDQEKSGIMKQEESAKTTQSTSQEQQSLIPHQSTAGASQVEPPTQSYSEVEEGHDAKDDLDKQADWRANIRLLFVSFLISSLYTLCTYFVPYVRNIPILGFDLGRNWLWTLNPSPAYVGQGIIMGPSTTLHMLLGAIVGWGILSPLAKSQGWAPGPVKDWSTGSKGWIVWVSLAIMLADSLISLGWLVARPLIQYGPGLVRQAKEGVFKGAWRDHIASLWHSTSGYTPLTSSNAHSSSHENSSHLPNPHKSHDAPSSSASEPDAPPHQLVSTKTFLLTFALSIFLSIVATHVTFGTLMPFSLTVLALLLALLLSVMGVRALGETDLNPVSGISKLTQLAFALFTPRNNPNAVIINLVAGAISESGALQAGDLLQDLKTGHLLGAAPKAQFWGQIIGSAVGAVASALVYKLYTNVYQIPGDLFQVPTAYVWVFTARLVTGQGLPPMVGWFALGAGLLFVCTTVMRIAGNEKGGILKRIGPYIPGGIAVAVGMYNVPSFTLARTIGGLLNWYWCSYRKESEPPIIVLASGLILGEGLFSIVNLILASLHIPHLE
ncbi:MAG: hypothetical protein M1822_009121 [Bathelium mastoideum]|nr:MAG: hypothetical protein M1822_009121 [Bathelium mastoideum]